MLAPRLLLVLALLWPVLAASEPGAAARPHIVLISIDTLRADHLTPWGYPRETSPQLAAFARQCVVFEEAFSHSQKTAASHMTLMTSLHPEVHGVGNPGSSRERVRLSDDIPTLAERLRAGGYRTHAVHGGGNVSAEYGFARGFESYEHDSDLERMLERAQELVSEHARAGGAPLFLFLHTYQVHGPYTPPAEHARLFVDPAYAGGIVSSPEELKRLAPKWPERNRVYWQRVDPKRPEDLRRLSDLYDGGIHYTDAKVGGFLTWLAAQPGWPRTLVVLLSDHGEEFGEHGALRHTTLHRETLHVPLMLRFPDARPEHRPRHVGSVVRLIDVMPSVLDYARLPLPDPIEGRSLLPLLRGEAKPPAFVWSTLRRGGATALRVGEWKLIRSGEAQQLFRVTTDPGEQVDLHAAEPVRAAQLAAQLDALLAAAEKRRAAFGASEVAPLDADTTRQLEALGYLDELPAPAP